MDWLRASTVAALLALGAVLRVKVRRSSVQFPMLCRVQVMLALLLVYGWFGLGNQRSFRSPQAGRPGGRRVVARMHRALLRSGANGAPELSKWRARMKEPPTST